MSNLSRSTLIISLGLVFPCVSIQADTIVKYEVNDRGRPDVQTAQIAGGRVATTYADGSQTLDMIYDQKQENFTIIQHQDKSYMILDESKVDEFAAQAAGVRDMIMEGLPADQQDQAAALLENLGLGGLAQKAPPAPEKQYIKTTETQTIAGYPCQMLKVVKNGKQDTEMCVAKRSDLKIPEADYHTLRAMHEFSQRLANKASVIIGALGASFPDLAVGKIDGLPIAVKDIDDNVSVTLLEIAEATVNSDRMNVPAGYRETELPKLTP